MPTTTFRTVNGRILGHNKAGVASEYLLDPLGSVIGTSTSAGVVSNRTTYWPYGEVRTGGVSSVTPFGFCGGWGYYTDSSGSLYVRARYYRSSLTRWQTVDSLWPSESAYGYGGIQPVYGIDPTGTSWIIVPPPQVVACAYYSKIRDPWTLRRLNRCIAKNLRGTNCKPVTGKQILCMAKAACDPSTYSVNTGRCCEKDPPCMSTDVGPPCVVHVCLDKIKASPKGCGDVGAPIPWGNPVLFNLLHEIGHCCGYEHQVDDDRGSVNRQCNDILACCLNWINTGKPQLC